MSTAPKDDDPTAATAPIRAIPRKLSLRVSGTRVGSSVRPAASSAPAAAADAERHFGLRVHSSLASALPSGALRGPAGPDLAIAAPRAAVASLVGDPYSVDDHERR
jgi:hypothetical protein